MIRVGTGHKGRVFYSYLLSFLAILLVPVIMSLFVFQRANAVIQADAESANDALLTQTRAYLDMLIDDVLQLNFLVSYNNRLEALLYDRLPLRGEQYYLAWGTSQEFQDYRDSTSAIVDFYVYLPNVDMVVSPDGYFTTWNFHLARRGGNSEQYDEWLANLRSITRTTFRPDRVALPPRIDVDVPIDTIEIVSPLPASQPTTQPRGYVVLQMRQDLFLKPIEGTTWSDQSIFLVYHPDQGLISSSAPRVTSALLDDEGIVLPDLAERAVVSLDGVPHVAFTRESDLDYWRYDLYYTLLIPRALFTNQFTALQRYTYAAFAISIIAGIALIYWIASVRYRPIHNLLAMLKPDVDGSFTLQSDEFQMIRSSLQATLAEDRLLREEIDQSRSLMAQRFLQQLLKGSLDSSVNVDEQFERLGLEFMLPWVTLALLEPDLVQRANYPRVVELVEREAPRWPDADAFVIRDLDGMVAILYSTARPDQNEIGRQCGLVKARVEAEFAVSCAAGMSDSHRCEDGFGSLLHEARAALSYRLVRGSSKPIRFSEVLTTGRTYYYPIEDENRLINSITSGGYPAASEILAHVFRENFDEARLSVEMARCLMFDLISTMIKALNSISSVEEDAHFWSEVKPISRLTSCHSLEELRDEIDDILERVCERVLAGKSTHAEQFRIEIFGVIEANLHDRNLGPEMVAERIGKNSAYVARFFREEVGVGMSGHIKLLRIAEARHLLANSDCSVRQIAELIGFGDSNALIRAFKCSEGVTPGEYRDSFSANRASSTPDTTNMRN